MDSECSFGDGRNPTEQMFLLECQVKRVLITSPDLKLKLGSDDLILCENTRVTLSFMNYPEIELCENDEEEKMRFGCTLTEPSCGKSCLFVLSESQLLPFMRPPVSPCSFKVQLRIYGLDSFCGDSPTGMLLGCTVVPMGELFSDMLDQSDEIMDVPVTCCTQQDFPLRDNTGTEVGSVFASVRISCFGKMILAPMLMGAPSKKDTVTEIMQFDPDQATVTSEACSEDPCDVTSIFKNDLPPGAFTPTVSGSTSKTKSGVSRAGSESDWMDGYGGSPSTCSPRDPAPYTLTEPEFTYEEIRAVVNGHSLFFKILKKGKKTEASGKETVVASGRDRSCSSDSRSGSKGKSCLKKCPKKNAQRASCDQGRRQQQQGPCRGEDAYNRDFQRKLQAQAGGNGGYRVSVDPQWEKQLKSEDNLIADGLVPIEGPDGSPGRQDKADEAPVKTSKCKELFSISVGNKVMSDGATRPKLVLEIRAPKTQEDLDKEEAAIDADEDRQKRREDRRKASGLVTDATQYITSDFGDSDECKKGGGKGDNKEGKGKGKGKGKKGKK